MTPLDGVAGDKKHFMVDKRSIYTSVWSSNAFSSPATLTRQLLYSIVILMTDSMNATLHCYSLTRTHYTLLILRSNCKTE